MTDESNNDEPHRLSRADLKEMSPAAILASYEAGELDHLINEGTGRHLGLTAEQAELIVNKFDNNL